MYCPKRDGIAYSSDCFWCKDKTCEKERSWYRIIVAGPEYFSDYKKLLQAMRSIAGKIQKSRIEILSGASDGAAKLGELFAQKNGLLLRQFPADHGKYGKKAGVIRNIQMVRYAAREYGALLIFQDGIDIAIGQNAERGRLIAAAEIYGLNVYRIGI